MTKPYAVEQVHTAERISFETVSISETIGQIPGYGTTTVETMTITNGRAGIGTTNPTHRLHIVDEYNYALGIYQYNNADRVAIRGYGARGTMAAPTALQTDNTIFGLRTFGHDGTNFSSSSIGSINFHAASNFTPTNHGTYIEFSTSSLNTIGAVERMRIADDGNVGIGTTIITSKLRVEGNAQFTGNILPTSCNVYDLGHSNFRWRDLYLSGTTIDLDGVRIQKDATTGGLQVVSSTNQPLDTSTRNLTASGNVGIGTTNPQARLHVLQDSASAYAFRVDTPNSTNATPFVIKANGYVGIGTTNPTSLLEVHNVEQGNRYGATVIGENYMILGDQRTTTGTAMVSLNANANVANAYGKGLSIRNDVVGEGITSEMYHEGDGRLFISAPNATNGISISTPNKTVFPSGNVGIGSTTPTAKLQVFDATQCLQRYGVASTNAGTTRFNIQYFSGSGAEYWKIASGVPNSAGAFGHLLIIDGDMSRVNDARYIPQFYFNTSGTVNTFRINGSMDGNGTGTSVAPSIQVWRNTNNNTVDIYLVIDGFTSLNLSIQTNYIMLPYLNTTVSNAGAPVASGSYILHYDLATNATISTTYSLTASSSGSVGIGTNVPIAKLHISQNEALDSFRVDDALGDTTPFIVKADGNVGIGTTTPYATMDILGNMVVRAGVTPAIALNRTGNFNALRLGYAINATEFSSSAGADDGVIRMDDNTKKLHLQTGTGNAMMTITSGSVGIGTSTPAMRFYIAGGDMGTLNGQMYPGYGVSNEDCAMRMGLGRMLNANAQGNTYIDMFTANTLNQQFRLLRTAGSNGEMFVSQRGTGAMKILTEEAAPLLLMTQGLERMRIISNGNVGIGITNPSAKLEISSSDTPGYDMILGNTTSNANAFSIFRLRTNDATSDFVIFKNHNLRSGDGGNRTTTIRNDGGDLRLQGTNNGLPLYLTNSAIGIGTTIPLTYFNVYNTFVPSLGQVCVSGSNATLGARLTLLNNFATNPAGMYNEIAFINTGTSPHGYIRTIAEDTNYYEAMTFGTMGGAATGWTATEKMRISGAGAVGIGTSVPRGRLHVVGDRNIIGNGGGIERSINGLTVTTSNLFQHNPAADQGDGSRGITIVNEAPISGGYANLTFRTNPGGSFENMMDMRYVSYGTGAGNSRLAFMMNGSSSAEKVCFTSDGFVGIGKTNPSLLLDVAGTARLAHVVDRSINFGSNEIKWYAGGVAHWSIINDGAGTFNINNTSVNAAIYTQGTPVISCTVGNNVGIATTNPQKQLHVFGSSLYGKYAPWFAENWANIICTPNAGTGETGIHMQPFNNSRHWIYGYSNGGGNGLNIGGNGMMTFQTGPLYNAAMTLLTDGNIGIGNTVPTKKLDVTGEIKASSYIQGGQTITSITGTSINPNGIYKILELPAVADASCGGSVRIHGTVGGWAFTNAGSFETTLSVRDGIGIYTRIVGPGLIDGELVLMRNTINYTHQLWYIPGYYNNFCFTVETGSGMTRGINFPSSFPAVTVTYDANGYPILTNYIGINKLFAEAKFSQNYNGRVGIGTSNPLTSCHIFDGAGTTLVQLLHSTNNTTNGVYTEYRTLNSTARAFVGIDGFGLFDISRGAALYGSSTAHPLILTTSGLERMRILSGGNVGIGSTTPFGKLNVFSTSLQNTQVYGTNYGSGTHRYNIQAFTDGAATYWKICAGVPNVLNGWDYMITLDGNLSRVNVSRYISKFYFNTQGVVNQFFILGEFDTDGTVTGVEPTIQVWRNTSNNTVDIYIVIESFSHVDLNIMVSNSMLPYFTNTITNAGAPVASGSYILYYDILSNPTLCKRITNTATTSGSVGIGLTNPSNKLHIKDNVGTDVVMIENLSSTGFAAIRYKNNSAGNLYIGVGGTATPNYPNQAYILGSGITQLKIESLNVGIGVAPSHQLHLSTDAAAKLTTNTWIVTSDARIKTNIIPADLNRCYDVVKSLPLKYYGWDSNLMPDVKDRHMLGWIAQEVEPLIPNAVTYTSNYGFNDFRGLDSDQIIKFMYGALQKSIEKIEILTTSNEMLLNEIATIKTHIGM